MNDDKKRSSHPDDDRHPPGAEGGDSDSADRLPAHRRTTGRRLAIPISTPTPTRKASGRVPLLGRMRG